MRWILSAALFVASGAWAQGGAFVEADEPPPGVQLDPDATVWLVDLRAAFPGGLSIGAGQSFPSLAIHRQGIVGLGGQLDEAVANRPRPLAAVGGLRILAPFWSVVHIADPAEGEPAAHPWAENAVYALVEAGRVRVTWHEILPRDFEPLARPVSFALQIERTLDGVVVQFEYLEAGATGAFDPRAGFVIGERVMELFREPTADEIERGEVFSVPADRAKALFDGGSDGEPGVWRFEIGLDGHLGGDADEDGVQDEADNCPRHSNPLQLDLNNENGGDVCDTDDDGDTVRDIVDNCPREQNVMQHDLDRDGRGDVCDADRDGDGISNGSDNCPDVHQLRQHDLDGDGRGDVCDADVDGDDAVARLHVGGARPDNCPGVYDPTRKDSDGDGLGDVCDLLPQWHCSVGRCPEHVDWDGDGVGDSVDLCPWVPDPQVDTDKDGVGDACDPKRFDEPDGVIRFLPPIRLYVPFGSP